VTQIPGGGKTSLSSPDYRWWSLTAFQCREGMDTFSGADPQGADAVEAQMPEPEIPLP
jgi:hypothetical protein